MLGDVHLVTSLFFDFGVYLIVVGLMLDILRSLGSGIDRQIDEETSTRAPLQPTTRRRGGHSTGRRLAPPRTRGAAS